MFELKPMDVLRLCDVETTGFKPAGEICEIGWVDIIYYPEGWQIVGEHQSRFVNPGHRITNSHIHNITDDMVVDGMTPAEARALLAKGAVIHAAHNARFDRQFIQSSLPWVCTLEGARKVWPGAPNHKNETLKAYLGIEVEGDAHRAGYDAAVSARILMQLFKHLTLDELIQISDPGHVPTVMAFGKHKGERIANLPMDYINYMLGLKDLTKGLRIAFENQKTLRGKPERAPAPARAVGDNWWDRGDF
jgi:exodeoxyribonuclease X